MILCRIYIVLLLLPFTAYGEDNADSLWIEFEQATTDTSRVRQLILLWEATAYTDPGQASLYAEKALAISNRAGYEKGKAEAYQRIASGYMNRSVNDTALAYYDSAQAIYDALGNNNMVGVMLHNKAILHYSQGEYVQAMLKTEESLRKSSESNDEHGVASSLQLLGNIHHYLGNYDEAQKYLLQGLKALDKLGDRARYADGLVYLASNYQALDKNQKALENLTKASILYQEMNDYFFLAQALNNAAFIHINLGNYDSASPLLEESITLSIEHQNNATLLLARYNQGRLYEEKKQYGQSMAYYDEALVLAAASHDRLRAAMAYRKIGDVLIQQGRFKEALIKYDSALFYGNMTGSKSSLKETYHSLSEAYESRDDHAMALDYFRKYADMNDSIFSENRTAKIEEMEARFEKEKQDAEITLQKSEIKLLSKDLELQSLRQKILVSILIISVILGFWIAISLRQKMKRNRLIREQEKSLEEEKLKNARMELEIKNNELTSHTLQIAQKNELLSTLKRQLMAMEDRAGGTERSGYRRLRHMINGSAQTDRDWENFNRHFDQVHQGFLGKLKDTHPALTSNDLRLSAMLKLNLNSKEVAGIMNISPDSVKKARHRLRKKLNLPEEADLHSFMMKL
jgi:tetratricopeptide (TPR) repeat protein